MTIVASTRLGTCRVRFRRGLGASQTCLGRVLAALGLLLGSSWTLLGVSWAPFASFMDAHGCLRALVGASSLDFERLWCLRAGCWRAPLAVFAIVFGHAFLVSPRILCNA